MRNQFAEKIRRSRTVSTLAVLAVLAGIALSSGDAQGRVDPIGGGTTSTLSQDTTAKATGGGTVLMSPTSTTFSSFGLNARRPVGYTTGDMAEGRVNYVRHKNMPNRHVNVPVVLMEAGVNDALLAGDCAGATCPAGSSSVIVYVKDVADSGAGQDIFHIYFCQGSPSLPTPFVPGGTIQDCSGPEGNTLRTGNIQVRGEAAIAGESIATASGSGAYTATPSLNGLELAGGTFALGLRTAGPGDLEAQLNGVSPLFGLSQQVTITGVVTTASVNGGTITFSGTASLDMGDGAPPINGLALSGSATATGVTMTVGSWALGTLPVGDGVIKIE